MRIRIKARGSLGYKRIESLSKIDDIMVKDDLLNPEKDRVFIYFRGESSSGVLDLNEEEAKRLISTIKPVLGLVKDSEKIKG